MPNINFDFELPEPLTPTAALSTQNTAGTTLAVIVLGTAVPLANVGYINGFTDNAGLTQFTAQTTGVYRISFKLSVTASLLMSCGVYRNGTAISSLQDGGLVSVSDFSGDSIVTLTAGDTLSLMLYGLLGTAVLSSGTGAYMIAQQIS